MFFLFFFIFAELMIHGPVRGLGTPVLEHDSLDSSNIPCIADLANVNTKSQQWAFPRLFHLEQVNVVLSKRFTSWS